MAPKADADVGAPNPPNPPKVGAGAGGVTSLVSGSFVFDPQNGLLVSTTGVEDKPNMFLGGGGVDNGLTEVELAKKLGMAEVDLGGSSTFSFVAAGDCTGGVLNENAGVRGAGAGVGVGTAGLTLGGEGAAERSGDAIGFANENGKEVNGGSLASTATEGCARGEASLAKVKLAGMLKTGAFLAASSSICCSFCRSPSSSSIPSSSS